MAELTPMMRQYMEIKEQNPDSILFSVWVTSTRCSAPTPARRPASWIWL